MILSPKKGGRNVVCLSIHLFIHPSQHGKVYLCSTILRQGHSEFSTEARKCIENRKTWWDKFSPAPFLPSLWIKPSLPSHAIHGQLLSATHGVTLELDEGRTCILKRSYQCFPGSNATVGLLPSFHVLSMCRCTWAHPHWGWLETLKWPSVWVWLVCVCVSEFFFLQFKFEFQYHFLFATSIQIQFVFMEFN